MAGHWPLVGRDEELAFIAATAKLVDRPRGVVLAGAPGVGKTRLAREALDRFAQRGATCRWAVGTASARGLPLAAFAGLLGSWDDSGRQVQQAVDAVVSGAGRGGVAVGVDDAHLLDEVSAHLVHQLVLRSAATTVVTVRTGEPAPDAITALWKDEHLERLEVQALAEPESLILLELVLGGPVDSAAARRMWALTRGNALYLRHLVSGELQAGRLRQVGGVWRWSGDPTLPAALAELVEARMGVLSEPVRHVVDVLAVGEPLEEEALGRLADPEAVEQAEVNGLIRVEREALGVRVRLAHPLYGELRRARLGELRGRRLRGLIAVALAADGTTRPEETLRRAVLMLDSDLDTDPALFAMAARTTLQLGDFPLAERLSRAAVAAGDGFDARLVLAYAVGFQSRGAEAEAELADLMTAARTDVDRATVGWFRVGNLFWTRRRPAEAEAVLAHARAVVGDSDVRRPLTALHAAFDAFLGRPARAVETAREVLASSTPPDHAIVMASYGLVLGLGVLGRMDELGLAADRAYEASRRSFESAFLAYGLADVHLVAIRLAGTLHDVDHVAARFRGAGSDLPGSARLFSTVVLGHAALVQGRLRAAISWLREARAGLAHVESHGHEFVCQVWLTQALAMSGARAQARRALAELAADVHPSFVYLEPEVVLTRAWVSAAEGAVQEATALAHEAASIAAGRGQCAHEVLALHAAVCFGDRTPATRLAELARQVDGPRAPLAAAHAAALAHDDPDGLLSASRGFEAMGDLLSAADAAAHTAIAYTRQGRSGSALTAAARAHRLAEACEGARTPALIAAAHPLPLTEREREIVTLAAQGLSNRQVAERLVVSVRTVEGHLYRAHAKLGTTDRAEFAALLRGD